MLSVAKSRSLLEHKVDALIDKAENDYKKTSPERRPSIEYHNAHKERLAKDARDPHFKSVRRQWELKLQQLGLRMEDWTDISTDEIASVIHVLGNPEEDPAPPIHSFSLPSSYPTPLAPSLSSSTRSTNVSTASSYALVDPSEFHSEEEEDSNFFFPVVCLLFLFFSFFVLTRVHHSLRQPPMT